MRIRVPLREGAQSSPRAKHDAQTDRATTRPRKFCEEAGYKFLKRCSKPGRARSPSMPTTVGSESCPYILNNRQRRKFSSEHNLARGAQPFVEHSPVNATEVGVEFQIVVIQVRQARIFPE